MPKKDLPPLKYDVPEGFTPEKFQRQWTKILSLSQEKVLLERQMFLLNSKIEEAWRALPITLKPRPFLQCMYKNCSEKTQDRFGGRAMCARHVAHGDSQIASLLDEFLHGDD